MKMSTHITKFTYLEPRRGEFDFGNGTNDFSEFLNVRRYIEMAKEEDLLVLFRPGNIICR